MKCPYCLQNFTADWKIANLDAFNQDISWWLARACVCPNEECLEVTIEIYTDENNPIRVWPKNTARPLPSEVADKYKSLFEQACAVQSDSPMASAALSRRCLQQLLVEKGGAKKFKLSEQINEVIPSLPSDLGDQLHATREIGNFAAHTIKDTNTGEIVEVEAGEAGWNLDVLEELFDYYLVRPERLRQKKEDINIKLVAAGREKV